MKQYHELLKEILNKGTNKPAARAGLPGTKSRFGAMMRFDMADGFPLLTTKKMFYKSIIVELLWFLKGQTNIKYLVDRGCNIWNDDAYRYYKNYMEGRGYAFISKEDYIDTIKQSKFPIFIAGFVYGVLGDVYGKQWRNWNGATNKLYSDFIPGQDQLLDLVDGIRKNPTGRRHIITAWNPTEIEKMALPPCHLLMQFNCRQIVTNQVAELHYYLDLEFYMRSADVFLGVPFNIASYALLLHIVAEFTGMIPGELIITFGDVHIYDNHMDAVNEQLTRDTGIIKLPTLDLSEFLSESHRNYKKAPHELTREELDDFIINLSPDHFEIRNYESYPAIKAELSVGA